MWARRPQNAAILFPKNFYQILRGALEDRLEGRQKRVWSCLSKKRSLVSQSNNGVVTSSPVRQSSYDLIYVLLGRLTVDMKSGNAMHRCDNYQS